MIIEEVQTWSEQDLYVQIHLLLPEGWHFHHASAEGFTSASITDATDLAVWECEEPLPDRRMIMLEAYGWLYYRQHKTSNPVWTRRREIDRHTVLGRRGLPGVENVPDPGDLDPTQIEEIVRKKSGGSV